jgi:cellulose synthase/poly-beta-1,6-N-acetylglucosamine synthase-like glycosyltransferase
MSWLGVGSAALAAGKGVLVAMVLLGVVPVLTGTYQILLAALHGLWNHYRHCGQCFPRTVVIIPAWNEAAVIGDSIDRLMKLDYPRDALRVYVVNDASTDATPDVVRAKRREYPGQVQHLRRERGGQGKAHTLNHGLVTALADDWMQALLIMDADVIFLPTALRMMTRHLADPRVGAVTGYIKEGSRPGNYLTRFIAFEYVTAQAAARRGQNVLGAMACLAGGAQLHSRANLEAIGGRIDTSSLAEDTITTFGTQLAGNRAVFEPHAVVIAEEPGRIAALWRQRMRWARGNVQVTRRYRRLWFRPTRAHGLGGVSFGLFWFSILLQPVFMILASIGLVTLFFTDPELASRAFRGVWIITALSFLLITMLALTMDPATGRRCWPQAVMFPGLVSLALITYALFPGPSIHLFDRGLSLVGITLTPREERGIVLAIYLWLALSMVVAWLAKVVEDRRGGRWLSPLLLYLGGYGPLLCAVTFAAYVKELRHSDMTWEKTEKTGKAIGP